jgi:hypothetical protein
MVGFDNTLWSFGGYVRHRDEGYVFNDMLQMGIDDRAMGIDAASKNLSTNAPYVFCPSSPSLLSHT